MSEQPGYFDLSGGQKRVRQGDGAQHEAKRKGRTAPFLRSAKHWIAVLGYSPFGLPE